MTIASFFQGILIRPSSKDHAYWLQQAYNIAHAPVEEGGSHNPNIQVGAVILDAQGLEISRAANRPPKGISMTPERLQAEHRRFFICCAEQMALMTALRHGRSCRGGRIYTTSSPCRDCARLLIEAGITQVFIPESAWPPPENTLPIWKDSAEDGRKLLEEAGVQRILVPFTVTPE